jgi:hypothetical protein
LLDTADIIGFPRLFISKKKRRGVHDEAHIVTKCTRDPPCDLATLKTESDIMEPMSVFFDDNQMRCNSYENRLLMRGAFVRFIGTYQSPLKL